jgi:GH15 family glucan-1,4-alpha-glucosidase
VTNVSRIRGYLPISGYGLIGDCRSAALVGEDGSIDWLCLPRFDDASVFGRILDAKRGGHWRISTASSISAMQRYRDLTNVLTTVFHTGQGRLMVVDFMPVEAETMREHARLADHPRLVRIVHCLGGEVDVRNAMHPAPDSARADVSGFRGQGRRFHGDAAGQHLCIRATASLSGAHTEHHLTSGETIAFALSCSPSGRCPRDGWTVERAWDLYHQTTEYWWRWAQRITYHGPFTYPVQRSALALKLMTYAPTGAIVAAPSCSLPEAVGQGRNWDYRYTWLRDASFTLYAFFQLGLVDEATGFFGWLTELGIGSTTGAIDNLYTIDGSRDTMEITLPHLTGYRRSRPVRVGNAAARQLQLDVYGEVLDSAYLWARFGGQIDARLWTELHAIVDLAIAQWELPDASIWEVRGANQHFTYSKVMCWVAVDRGLRIAERFGLRHDAERWRSARRAMHRRVIAQGWNPTLGAFSQTLGGDTCDAALLRMSQVRFLDDRDPRMRSTVDTIGRRLREGALVRRYLVEETDDGLGSDEGAFLMCSFWLVDALAHMGEVEDAERLFERLLCFSAPLGLLSEEADARTGELLGNYPQAFTHLALVGAAVNIERARHRRLSTRGLHRPQQRAGS